MSDKMYFDRFDNAPSDVIIVKLADRLNNVSRLGSSQEEGKKERYIKEMVDHYLPMARKHSQYFYEKITDELQKLNDLK